MVRNKISFKNKNVNMANKPKNRLAILKKHNYKCCICGCNELCKLQMHHLLYDLNADQTKITILVCRKCHKRIHRNKNLNLWLT